MSFSSAPIGTPRNTQFGSMTYETGIVSRSSRYELVTNIVDQPTVWGTGIPFTAGQIRVQGSKVWASPFVRIIDEALVNERSRDYNPDQADNPIRVYWPDTVKLVTLGSKIAYNIAFSFGYNITPQYGRILSRMWINGLLAYDLKAGNTTGVEFEFHKGRPSGEQSPLMIEDLGADKAPFFPDQTYIVLNNIKLADFGNQPLQTVSAEFVVNASGGGDYVVYAPIDAAIDVVRVWIDWDNRVGYAWGNDANNPNDNIHGTIVKYDIDTFAILSKQQVVYAAAAGPANANPGRAAVWLPQSKIVFFPRNDLQNGVVSFALNVETARIFASIVPPFEQYPDQFTFTNWSDGVALRENERGAEVLVRSIGSSNIIFVYNVSLSGITGVTRYRGTIDDLMFDRMFSDRQGNAYYVNTAGDANARGLYRLTSTGYSRVRALPPEVEAEGFADLGVYAGSLYWFTGLRVIRESLSGQRTYSTPYPAGVGLGLGRKFERAELGGGTIGWQYDFGAANSFAVLELTSGGISVFKYNTEIPPHKYWDSFLGRFIGIPADVGRSITTFTPNISQGGTVKLRDFMTALFAYSGDRDISRLQFIDINDDILGGIVVEPTNVETIIASIMALFRINRIDRADATIFYRNQPISGTVTPSVDLQIEDLSPIEASDEAASEQASPQVKLKVKRASPQNIPDKVELKFIDPEAEYMENTISWYRPGASSDSNSLSLSLPIVLKKDQALVLVQNTFVDVIDYSNEYECRLPPQFSYLEAGDIFGISHGGKVVDGATVTREFTDVLQILEDTHNADGSVSVLARGVTLESGLSFSLPTIEQGRASQAFGNRKATRALIIDSTAATIQDDPMRQGRYAQYMVLYPQFKQGWTGGYLARYNGSTWETLYGTLGADEVWLFRGTTPLTNKRWITDTDTLTLSNVVGEWNADDNATRAELDADPTRNLAFYGVAGRWELIQFEKIENNVMSGIRRGMRGTEVHAGNHQTGDWVVIVRGYVMMEQRDFGSIMTDQYRAVGNEQVFETAPKLYATAEGNSAKPWAVTGIQAIEAAGDVMLLWRRRDRLFSQLGEQTGIAEASEKYDVEIYEDASAEEPLRTFAGIEKPELTYTAADMATDGTTGATTLHVMIYQLSADVGRGYAERIAVDVG